MKIKLLHLFILIVGIIFSLGQVGRISLFPGVVINGLDIIAGISAVIVLIQFFRKKTFRYQSYKRLLLFAGVSLLALFIQSSHYGLGSTLVASLYLFRLLCYWSIFYLLKLNPACSQDVRKVMLGSGVIVVILGFIQYIYYPNLRNLFYLGWDEHLFRLFSTFLDPNFAGAYFAIFFFFILFFLLKAKKRNQQIIYSFFSLATLLALYLTYSRTAIIMLVVGVVVLFAIYGKKFFMLLSIFILLFGFVAFANRGIEGLDPLRIASSKARLQTMQNGFTIFLQNPVIGIGFNAIRYEQIRQGLRVGEFSLVSHADAGVDNSYLFLLATTGVVGASLYLLFLRKIINETVVGLEKLERAILGSLGASFLVGGLFMNLLFFSPILFFVICFVGTIRSKKP